uniref:Trehalase n=1 Tax=Bionectria ochroleuca TaxID=29856 RepID=A0A0B7K750_BIOOC
MALLARAAALTAALAATANALYINGSVIAPCDSPIYCHGELLKQVELAQPFSDSKTFVDMPAIKPLEEIQAAFDKLEKPLSNNSALNDFLDEYFADAGGELVAVPEDQLTTDPVFLNRINDTVIQEFTKKVIDIWPDLTRQYSPSSSSNCTSCPNSFIPVNHTFVVAGGRFREPYYWDSYWVIEGLLRTGGSFTEISKNIIENFLDFVEDYGFVPNAARIYYLNRSQPPLLSLMIQTYVDYTNDTEILDRALPLLVKEHEFFMNNRTVDVQVGNKTYTLNRYAVENTQPRPESYREDYITARNSSYYAESGIVYPETVPLNDSQVATLYSHLASGAESGWDYTSRWIANPEDGARDPSVWPPLMHILMQGLRNTPATFGEDDPSYVEVQDLALRLGQRYLDSTFCTWLATGGGSTSETPKLQGLSDQDVGIMFEKYADNSTNRAGGGGEYEVVEGFGWTNGVLIWTVDEFGNQLQRPDCGDLQAAHTTQKRDVQSAVELHVRDGSRVKKFGKRAKRSV